MENRFCENFSTIDGKYYKLDQTKIQDFSADIRPASIFNNFLSNAKYTQTWQILR